jgi:hypothetical protein
MRSTRTIRGTVVDVDEPTWAPLVAVVGGRQAEWFMWMYAIALADETRVHAYKHVSTRRYVHLGEDGRGFEYVGDKQYREMDPDDAADLALPLISEDLPGWEPDENAGWEPGEDARWNPDEDEWWATSLRAA